MEIITTLLAKLASGIGPFFLLLGLLIFVHELGHYLVAVYFGVRVETFSLGFGKKIWSYKRGDTTYCLSLIPLGGYVKMYGDDPTAEIPEEQKKYSFLHKPVWPRIAIVLAGPLMNLFFAIAIFALLGLIGESVPGPKIGDIDSTSYAYTQGFRSGDTVIEINGSTVTKWSDVKEKIENSADQDLSFTVKREDGNEKSSFVAKPTLGNNPFLFTTQRRIGLIDGLSTDSISTMLGVPSAESLGAKIGLKTFDVIEKINGREVLYWRNLDKLMLEAVSAGSLTLLVKSYGESDKPQPSREVTVDTTKLNSKNSILAQLGIMRSDLFLLNIKPSSPADKEGLKSGDYVQKIDGAAISSWQMVLDKVKSFKREQSNLQFIINRNGEEKSFLIAPEEIELPTEQGAMESRFAIGVIPAIMTMPSESVLQKVSNPLKAVYYGIEQSWVWSKLIAISLVRLVQNEVSARNIGGVITIGRVASKSFEVGLEAFLKMMAIISINLFLLNLLPVPVLDGGHLLFFAFEAIKGKPISFKKLEIAQQVGLVLLMSLMVFALFNDITHLISSW